MELLAKEIILRTVATLMVFILIMLIFTTFSKNKSACSCGGHGHDDDAPCGCNNTPVKPVVDTAAVLGIKAISL